MRDERNIPAILIAIEFHAPTAGACITRMSVISEMATLGESDRDFYQKREHLGAHELEIWRNRIQYVAKRGIVRCGRQLLIGCFDILNIDWKNRQQSRR